MGFFDSLFGPKLYQSRDRNEVERLLNELVQIGIHEDYLSERPGGSFNIQCRNVRTREIGKRLSELGGLNLMNWAFTKVKKRAGKALASHLEYAWEGVGEWQN
ncbi:MAG: hypothetical protein VB013_01280 [Anaerolineaceae bacterium]|nr:hypothetical protein [Anaerolineaceae bacterium]